jgi:2-polyprenyl-6-methoxyphenol hydroxylase-like FAD-dependent oxidoreductase
MLNRGEYWQCGYVIAKGKLEELRAEGLEAFKKRIVSIVPFVGDRVDELPSWDDIKLLTVKVDRLDQWYKEGLLCIGDSAHAMSPIAGVGINLAVQDAVAAANILWQPLAEGTCSVNDLRKVQTRRMYPTRMTQNMQLFLQDRLVQPTLARVKPMSIPWAMKIFNALPPLRSIPARTVGMGFRPEHVYSPDRSCQTTNAGS